MSLNDVTNSFISECSIKEKESGSLNGFTFGIKDSIPVKGLRCTSGSRVMIDNVAGNHAKIVKNILDNGGEILGKTNLHEFAIGATGTSSVFGPCRNPHDFERAAGGSSSGSAAAVASGLVDVGIGTDTGGSVRIPAALCGVIGYKPSNMYSRSDSEIPFSPIMETSGLITREYSTLQWVAKELFPNIEEMGPLTGDVNLGILGDFSDRNFDSFIQKVRSSGGRVRIERISIPLLESDGNRVRRTISAKDGFDAHRSLFEKSRCDYAPDVRTVLDGGSRIEKKDYENAFSMRKEIISQYNEVMFDYDAVVCPTTLITAPKILDSIGNEARYRESLVKNTELFNVVGAPSISLPSGFIEGLPTGLMISGGPGDDSKLLKVADLVSKLLPAR